MTDADRLAEIEAIERWARSPADEAKSKWQYWRGLYQLATDETLKAVAIARREMARANGFDAALTVLNRNYDALKERAERAEAQAEGYEQEITACEKERDTARVELAEGLQREAVWQANYSECAKDLTVEREWGLKRQKLFEKAQADLARLREALSNLQRSVCTGIYCSNKACAEAKAALRAGTVSEMGPGRTGFEPAAAKPAEEHYHRVFETSEKPLMACSRSDCDIEKVPAPPPAKPASGCTECGWAYGHTAACSRRKPPKPEPCPGVNVNVGLESVEVDSHCPSCKGAV